MPYYETFLIDSGLYERRTVPGDGNCWLTAVLAALRYFHPSADEIRARVVSRWSLNLRSGNFNPAGLTGGHKVRMLLEHSINDNFLQARQGPTGEGGR